MKLVRIPVVVLTAAAVAMLAGGCGGSSGPESSVNGCAIEAGTSCSGADLSGADLGDADLAGASLSGANLAGTNLSGANLTEANLSNAQIVDTDLSDADLTRANLTGATITGANLDGATLCGTTRTDGTTDDTSCPASTDTTETTETTDTDTTTTTVEATVTSFVAGTLSCPEGSSDGSITVSWTTKNATAVDFSVDEDSAGSSGPSGSKELDVPCDGATHELSVIAMSDAGAGETETKEITSS